ncbi:MAG: DUF2225 domain-containing protein [Leptospiraceae bacterium]|nr:DUF2225 domain-containing protein [Leptospiraceae bacterium]
MPAVNTKVEPLKKASFRSKDNSVCPVCDTIHQREQMFQGGGRLIAGKLTKELRRLYEKNKKYGRINPNDYVIVVCPKCLYASFPKDWSTLAGPDLERMKYQSGDRKVNLEKIIGPTDFSAERNLITGAGSFLLAIDSYQNRSPKDAPTPKKAVCALKAAWYFDDMHVEFPNLGYDKVRDTLYQKAASWYGLTLDIMQTGAEPVDSAAPILGPDTDNNWGFDGVIYLNAYLTMKFRDMMSDIPDERVKLLAKSKRMLAKLYGSGKSSKSKPSAILDMAKELYDELAKLIESLGGEK